MGSKGANIVQVPSSSASTTQTTPNPMALMAEANLLNRAQSVSQTPYQPYTGQLVQGFSPDQLKAFSSVNDLQGAAQPYINQARGLMSGAADMTGAGYGQAIENYLSPFTQNVVDATMAQLNNQFGQQQNDLTSREIMSGGFGGDRASVADAALRNQQGLAMGQTIGNLYQNAYQNAQNMLQSAAGTQLASGQGLGALGNEALTTGLLGTNAQLQTGGLQQQLGQAQLNAAYQQWLQQQAYPYNQLSWLSGIVNNTGPNMGGTQTQQGYGTQGQLAPSPWNTIVGAGVAGASLIPKKDGGRVHKDMGGSLGSWIPQAAPVSAHPFHIDAPQLPLNQAAQVAPSQPSLMDFAKVGQGLGKGLDAFKNAMNAGQPIQLPGATMGDYDTSGWSATGKHIYDMLHGIMGGGQAAPAAPSEPQTGINGLQSFLSSFGMPGAPNINGAYADGGAVRRGYDDGGDVDAPSLADAVWGRMIGQESRGHQFGKNGEPLTSPKGAIGVAQVMPGTAPEAAKLAGVPFDENLYRTDEAYNKKLGRAYFNKQLNDFGSPDLAAAAYNAGPGAVRNALAKANGGDYLGFLPQETRDYVAKVYPKETDLSSAPALAFAGPQDAIGDLIRKTAGGDGLASAPAPAETPAPAPAAEQGSGLLGLSPDARQALLAAGLGMMASQSPYLGAAIGQGGLAGLQHYENLQQRRETREEREREIRRQAEQFEKSLGLHTGTAAENARHNVIEEQLRAKEIAATASKNDPAQLNAQREAEADRLGLKGEERLWYVANGKLPTQGEKAPTGEQAKAATFASRMREANKIISDPSVYAAGLGAEGAARNLAEKVPVVGNAVAGMGERGPDYQKFRQAKRDFINAVLRRESGAAINQSEFDNGDKQYFPQPGDSDAVIAQKAKNRETELRAIANEASPSFKKEFFGEPEGAEGAPEASKGDLKPPPEKELAEARRALAARVPREAVVKFLASKGFSADGL